MPGHIFTVQTNFTRPADTIAYAAGDAVSDSTSAPTVLTFTGAAPWAGRGGIIISAILMDSAAQATKGQFELWLFDTAPTAKNDNAVFTPTDGENRTLVGVLSFSTATIGDATGGAGGNVVYVISNQYVGFNGVQADANLYGLLVVRNAYTPVASERFDIRLSIQQSY